jgi:hypothetical protein
MMVSTDFPPQPDVDFWMVFVTYNKCKADPILECTMEGADLDGNEFKMDCVEMQTPTPSKVDEWKVARAGLNMDDEYFME